MSQLVQSACPGCQKLLRIPSEWLHQPMRCKHCGMVMQDKRYVAFSRMASTTRPVPDKRTPPPATRKEHVTTAPTAKAAAPLSRITSAAPLAVPAAQAADRSPFADLHGNEQEAAPRTARRPRRGGGWKGPLLALAVFVIAGLVVYLNRQPLLEGLASLFPPDDDPVARNTKDDGAVSQPPPKKTAITPTPATAKTTKDKPPSSKPPSKPPSNKQPPRKDPPKNPPRNETVRNDPTKKPPRPAGALFPRRALLISVHDYLYANPIQNGISGANANNLNNLINALSLGLHIPLNNQIAHLSDAAAPKYGPRAPTKTVIEQTLTKFLDTSRPQDRIVVFFIGHSVELDNDVYVAPIEGELDRADTLIPLKWIYEQLAKCKARQKVLVLDVNRFHRSFGHERPGGEEMGPKLDALLKEPPPGVQVWSSCIAKQRSLASDDFPMGIFLDSLLVALRQGGNGVIQHPEDAMPMARYVDAVNKLMKDDLSKRKLEQVSRLTGKEADSGAAYDANQPPPPDAATCLAAPPVGVELNKMLVETVLDQVGTPPIKVTHEMGLRYDALPPFPVEALKKYEGGQPNPNSPLRKAVKNARAVLWAIYPGQEPKDLGGAVGQMRAKIRVQLDVLRDGYRAPGGGNNAEKQFKDRVENDERKVALLMRAIEDSLEELQSPAVTEARDSEDKRWKANYDFILARMLLEHAYLFEYQSMLGSMRKEFPPRDPALHGGWKLASQSRLQGDSTGKKANTKARKLLDKIIKDNAGSPWEVLAKREKLTNLGLEWQPTR